MEWVESLAKPQIIGPLIGLFAVIGWAVNKGLQQYFDHAERMEKLRNGIDPDAEVADTE